GNGVEVIVGECINLTESPGIVGLYVSSAIDIAGFQFNISGLTITSAGGGLAEENGFIVSSSSTTVVGFSMTGSTIGANGSVGCMDETACNYDVEATISGSCAYEYDCTGECGGSSVEDECGICNGPGAEIECWDGEMVCDSAECSDEPIYTDVDYETQIQPIFNANCTYYCHTDGGQYQGNLDLTSYRALMAGTSDHGPVVIPGDSENSIIIQKLSDEPPFGDQMPQSGPPYLDAAIISLIAAWIDEGALPGNGGTGDDGGGESCNEGYVDDCSGDGDCCPESWIGDGFADCEDQAYGCDLTCYDGDGGDCFDGDGGGDTGGTDGGGEDIEGCTDSNAENYNPDATIDDGSCTYAPLGELSFGAIDYDTGTLEINLDCEYAVSSFTFDLTGINITGYYGGTTEETGFDISIDGITISGNSTGENLPANSGLLVVLTFDAYTSEEICFSNSNIITYVGIEYEAILDDCLIIEDSDGCVGQIDECGVCGGDGIPDWACDCEGNVEDCAGECGGSAVIDECGVCGGDGIPDGECDCNG
ncbi:uncharacterized protein METZ01_LOCUS211427, partial [marine metagenome]